MELVYGLWPAIPGFSVQVAGFSFSHSMCTVTTQSVLYRDMIRFRNCNTSAWVIGEMHTGFWGEI